MIRLIAGEKGKGKTKYLLDHVNKTLSTAKGDIVYLDKNAKHMYELSNKIRLINLSDYLISDSSEFLGFISGIISQNRDIESMYLDSFLTMAKIEKNDDDLILSTLARLNDISKKYNTDFIVSLSRNLSELPEIPNVEILVSL